MSRARLDTAPTFTEAAGTQEPGAWASAALRPTNVCTRSQRGHRMKLSDRMRHRQERRAERRRRRGKEKRDRNKAVGHGEAEPWSGDVPTVGGTGSGPA